MSSLSHDERPKLDARSVPVTVSKTSPKPWLNREHPRNTREQLNDDK